MSPTVKFLCTIHLNLLPAVGNTQGVFTLFSHKLGFLVFRECTAEQAFGGDLTCGEKISNLEP